MQETEKSPGRASGTGQKKLVEQQHLGTIRRGPQGPELEVFPTETGGFVAYVWASPSRHAGECVGIFATSAKAWSAGLARLLRRRA